MTYYGGGNPGPDDGRHGRHRSPNAGGQPEYPGDYSAPPTRAYSDYPTAGQAYSSGQFPDLGAESGYDQDVYAEPEPEARGADVRPPRHPAILATLVGVTVFLATSIVAITLWALNDSNARRSENYAADHPSTTTVTVTETTTSTTTTTARPSKTRPSSAYESEDPDGGSAATATSGWYAQYGSFTSLSSAQELASQTDAEVYRGEEFGQPGQYIVAQREFTKSGAREACDISEKACVVKQVE
ncbi:hypothetical protein [Gordonia sp. (in: high G+C Gram-positive bacteria)]|uniref:hypothetical protein n=1 Tax=Gordonia sp. (in: high G+C Gram-positive bacteria) TaxID=84139 RepID=UPI0039E59557